MKVIPSNVNENERIVEEIVKIIDDACIEHDEIGRYERNNYMFEPGDYIYAGNESVRIAKALYNAGFRRTCLR